MLHIVHTDIDSSMDISLDKVSMLPYRQHMNIKSMDTKKGIPLLSIHTTNLPRL